MRPLMIVFAAALAWGGCGKKAATDSPRLPQVNDALTAAGFKLDGFKPADASRFSATSCAGGQLDGVDTIVCEFGSDDASQLGKKAGEAWVAEAVTGAVLTSGRTLLAVADRAHADPNGKTIHKITQAYSHMH